MDTLCLLFRKCFGDAKQAQLKGLIPKKQPKKEVEGCGCVAPQLPAARASV